jgi:hypothetical protein
MHLQLITYASTSNAFAVDCLTHMCADERPPVVWSCLQNGVCHRGANCPYSHNMHEYFLVRPPLDKDPVHKFTASCLMASCMLASGPTLVCLCWHAQALANTTASA